MEENDDAVNANTFRTNHEIKKLKQKLSNLIVEPNENVEEYALDEFITQVLGKKLKEDKEETEGLKELVGIRPPKNNPNNSLLKSSEPQDLTRSRGSSSAIGDSPITNNKVSQYNPFLTIPEDKLSEEEKKDVQFLIPKLQDCYVFYNEKKINPNSVGFVGNEITDAQTLACRDKFIYHYFGQIIQKSKHNSRNVNIPANLTVKLIISLLPASDLFRKVAALVTDTLAGITHTSLLIGQWKIEWFNTSLVSVKTSNHLAKETNAVAVIDLGELNSTEDIGAAFEAITDICLLYNCKKIYHNRNCNCQHFVTDIINKLTEINPKIAIPKQSSFQAYFNSLKRGDSERIYRYTETLLEIIKLETNKKDSYKNYYDKKEIVFNSRKEVDLFCYWLLSLGYFKTSEGAADYFLLKAFDRSFCLRSEDERTDVLIVEGEQCSFFTENGKGDDHSLKNIVYNTQDLSVQFPDRFL
ncbi:hypothetical protein ABK040_011177 [Willaertia magna]